MSIFHLFTVSPVVVAPFETPRVRYRDFMIHASSVEAAWAHIEASEGLSDICEVWGAPRTSEGDTFVITGPETEMSREHEVGQHLHWVEVQERYSLVHRGAVSLEAWRAEQRSRSQACTRPQLHLVKGGLDPVRSAAPDDSLGGLPSEQSDTGSPM